MKAHGSDDGIRPQARIDNNNVCADSLMLTNWETSVSITSNDVEMMLWAIATGEFQEYTDYTDGSKVKSQAFYE